MQAKDKLVVAIDSNYAPMSLLTPAAVPAGIMVEMWKLWSDQTGTEVDFLSGTWEETLNMVKTGKADVHSGLFRNDQRAAWLDFSDTLHSIKSAFYQRANSQPFSMDKLDGIKFGVVAGTYQSTYLRDKFPDILINEYDDHDSLITELIAGKIDIIFDEGTTVSRILARLGCEGLVSRVSGSTTANTVHAGVLKGKTELINRINKGFRNIKHDKLSSIDNRWIKSPEDRFYQKNKAGFEVVLTDEEKSYIQKNTSLSLTSTPNWPPFEMKQDDGSYAGIAADFIRVAAGKVGLDITPVFDTNWQAHMDKLKTGKLDAAPGLNETPKRLKDFVFTKPYIEYYSAIFTTADREDIFSPEDLAGKTVALEEGYAIARNLPTDRPDIKMLLVKSTQAALEAVATGKADAYIGNQVVASYLIKKFTLPNLKLVSLWRTDLPGQLRIAVDKDNPVLKNILQKGLDAITKKEREAILSTYLDATGFQQKVFSLTKEQWAWLKSHPQIKLGIDQQSAPFEFIDENGKMQGIASEYIAFIQDKLKVDMIPVDGLNWNEVLQYAKEGRLDILPSIARTPAREKYLLFTEPYIEFPVVIFSSKEAPLISKLDDIVHGRIALVEGYAAHEYITSDHPDFELVLYPTVPDAVTALALGKIDWFINDLATSSYVIEKKGITNLKVAAATEYVMSLSMAVRKDCPELLEIVNKALSVLSDEEAEEIKGKWLALKFEHGLDMYTVMTWALPITGGGLLIIGLIVFWNRKLGSEISERKKAQSELAETLSSLDKKNTMLEGLSTKLAKYLSPQVYDSIFSGNRDVVLSTERKKLTVFFSDIKDFTQTTDDMQPEDLTSLLNHYFTEMSAIALEYGATIDKFIGDAMLMFFGDPESKGVKEDAELCVRMAIAMQKRMVELEKEWHSMGYDKPFKMRVGINTGYCNVGNFGSEARMDYTIIGGEVNLAARLEGQADPGGVLMSSETYSLVKDIVNVEERKPIEVKGIRRTIQPYAVLSICGEDVSCSDYGKVIRYKEQGFNLSIDLNKLSPENRVNISQRLSEIALSLKE
ncbi:transporter substrate-binding domain-containing protein [Maridesulfovibrio ferrireducens]|uniref:transporter substrate-binding domain-containing protein n=1 Tax=Maridesulfovibrio ferrireducens TaxID=246191 RepID=UPI001A2C8C2D|nr:transporter substrate-binding domain-containing protein [Maridesulfovibrio ferrireducens]MBI9110246.1 transporter substrate-binding domain-containing protein [Maridesulfovibrio ferrireducens]